MGKGPSTSYNQPGYSQRHRLVSLVRGPASNWTCIRCRGPAEQWATLHGFSGSDPEDYVSLCTACHGIYDKQGVPLSMEQRAAISRGRRAASARRGHH